MQQHLTNAKGKITVKTLDVINNSVSKCSKAVILLTFVSGAQVAQTQNNNMLEEVIVTARGVEETVRDIPAAITVVSEERMNNLSITTFEDIASTTPGLDIIRSVSGSGAVISMRGIASNGNSIGIAQSVSTIMDGVYYENGRVINEGTFDVKQIAILKGPQALYFGKNATAGVITFETNDPTEEFEGITKFGYEMKEQRSAFEGILSGPISDTFGARLAVRVTDASDGLITNQAVAQSINPFDIATGAPGGPFPVPAPSEDYWPGQESLYARLTLDWAASDNLNVKLKVSQSEYETNSPSGARELTYCGQNGVAQQGFPEKDCKPDRKIAENPYPKAMADSHSGMGYFGGQLGEDYEATNVTLIADYTADNFDIVAYLNDHSNETNWVGDFDAGGLPNVMASENNSFDSTSIEIRMNSKFDGPVNLVGGLYIQETDRFFAQSVMTGGIMNSAAPKVGYIPGDYTHMLYDKLSESDGDTSSVYGEVIFDITNETQITAGVRYIEEEKDSYFKQPYVNPAVLGLWIPASVGIIEADQKHDDTVGEVTIRHQLTDTVSVYGAYKQGWKSGGFSNSGILAVLSNKVSDFTFEPEEVEGFEFGVKGLFADGSLSIDAEIFSYEFEGLQVDFFNSVLWSNVTYNAGSATTEGAEINVVYAPQATEGLTLHGSILFLDSGYDDFIAPCIAGQTPANGCTIAPNDVVSVPQQQLGGSDRLLAPDFSGYLGLEYETAIGEDLLLGTTINLQFKDDYSYSEFAHPYAIQEAYHQLDMSVRVGSLDGAWELALIGKNLTDEYVYLFTRDVPSTGSGTGTDAGILADGQTQANFGRTLEAVFTYRF
jgi:iron complex outermembrane receptor protein